MLLLGLGMRGIRWIGREGDIFYARFALNICARLPGKGGTAVQQGDAQQSDASLGDHRRAS